MLVLPLPLRMIPLFALMLPALAASLLLPPLFRRESIPTLSLVLVLLLLALLSFEILPATVDSEVGRRPPLTVPEPDLVLTFEEPVPTLVRVPLVLLVVLLVLDEVLGTVTLLLEGQCVAPLLRVTLPLVVAALVLPAGRRPDAVPDPLAVVVVVLLSLRRCVVVAVLATLLWLLLELTAVVRVDGVALVETSEFVALACELTVLAELVVCVVVPAGRRPPVTLFCAIVATDIINAVAIIAPRNELRIKVFIAVKF